jgi:hypothetical protein
VLPQVGKLDAVKANCAGVSPADKGPADLFWPEQAAAPASKPNKASTAVLPTQVLVIVTVIGILHSTGEIGRTYMRP